MARFVLFGSANQIALHFIRHASASSLKILCLCPYDTQDSDRHSLLISSLGGIPVRYNFRNTHPHVEGFRGHEGLKSILKGTKGVVWAADPDSRETTLSRNEERFTDYLHDLKCTFFAMREVDTPRRFLLLTKHVNHGLVGIARDEENWWRKFAVDYRSLASTDVEPLESTMNGKGLKWTILRVGRYLNGIPPLQPENRGIELGAKPPDGVWSDDVARTMVEILKVDELNSMFLDFKSVPATGENGVENVIRKLAKLNTVDEDSSKLADSLPGWTSPPQAVARTIAAHPPTTAFSAADPILSTVNPRNFPHQFARLAQQDGNSYRVGQLLEGVREGRTTNQIRSHEEAKQYEQLRQAREKARSEALKEGLPPPGTDPKMLRQVKSEKGPQVNPKEEFIIKTTRAVEVKQPTQSHQDRSRSIASAVDQSDQTSAANSGRTVFETLAEVLLDRSADYLSPHLVGPVVGNDYNEDGYHPRWKYNRWKLKPPRNRRQ